MTKSTRVGLVLGVAVCVLIAGSGILQAEEVWLPGEKEWYTKAAEPYKGQRITVVQEGSAHGVMVADIKGEFEKATGIKVNLMNMAWEDAFKKETADAAAGEGRYDILYIEGNSKAPFASREWLMPLEKFIYSELQSPWFDMQDINSEIMWFNSKWPSDSSVGFRTTIGRQVGLPFDDAGQILFYRRDLLNHPKEKADFRAKYGYELRVPRTTQEYLDVAEFFTRQPGDMLGDTVLKATFYGTCIEAKMGESMYNNFINWLITFGGGYYDDDLNVTIDSPESIEALKYYKKLTEFSPPGTLTYTWAESAEAVMQDRVFMGMIWNEYATLMDMPEYSRVVHKVDYAVSPAHPRTGVPSPVGAGCGAYISAFSKHPEASWLWLQWVTGKGAQTNIARRGGLCSPRLSVFKDPEVVRLSQDPNNPLRQLPVRAETYGMRAWMTPHSHKYQEMIEMIFTTLHPVLTGDKTAEEATKTLAEKLETLNLKEGYWEEILRWYPD